MKGHYVVVKGLLLKVSSFIAAKIADITFSDVLHGYIHDGFLWSLIHGMPFLIHGIPFLIHGTHS